MKPRWGVASLAALAPLATLALPASAQTNSTDANHTGDPLNHRIPPDDPDGIYIPPFDGLALGPIRGQDLWRNFFGTAVVQDRVVFAGTKALELRFRFSADASRLVPQGKG